VSTGGLWRSTQQYQSQPRPDEAPLRQRLRELAEQRRRFGAPRLHVLLRREGWTGTHKRTERLYRAEGLALRRRKHPKRAAGICVTLPLPTRPTERWSMDCLHDRLEDGRRFRVLTMVDDYSRECPALVADTSLTGARVVQVLDAWPRRRGCPSASRLIMGRSVPGAPWRPGRTGGGIQLPFIEPGHPTQNAYVESFNAIGCVELFDPRLDKTDRFGLLNSQFDPADMAFEAALTTSRKGVGVAQVAQESASGHWFRERRSLVLILVRGGSQRPTSAMAPQTQQWDEALQRVFR